MIRNTAPVSIRGFFAACFGLSAAIALTGCGGSSSNGGGMMQNPTVVAINFSGPPLAVATRIGDTGAFSAAMISGSTLTLSVPYGTSNFDIAFVCSIPSLGLLTNPFTAVDIQELSIQDGTSFHFGCSPSSTTQPTQGLLTGSYDISAFPSTNQLIALVGTPSDSIRIPFSPSSSFSTPLAPVGSDTVILYTQDVNANITALKAFTNQIVPGALNGGNTVTFTAQDATVVEPITPQNIPPGYNQASYYSLFYGGIGQQPTLSRGSTPQYSSAPAAALQGGNFNLVGASLIATDGSGFVSVAQATSTASPVAMTFPAPWTPTAPTPATWPTFTLNYNGFTLGKISTELGLSWNDSTSNTFYVYTLNASKNRLGSATTLAFPDLTSVTDFPAKPASGTFVVWSATVSQSSGSVAQGTTPNVTTALTGGNGSYTTP